ncbi:Predicted DNA-binding transcriptional regulator AlpA [Flaviramulus basaltis]|uniref:Predicted DNA-binding transcriptional regulator AlpA n=1 Tax=Flaviramulus basaltis TaxID=369401 RepID=A0A1K2IR28_9FLAO|nr:helix-turn-helix domain-containing protein [Flaviramulus basaltis]SFZ94893.1 Predicted DNA-binding transcriptional regulator AlpA [Flaviramulus basaltis]
MDEGGIQEYIPINSQDNQLSKIDSEELSDTKTEDSLLTISDLLKKFPISRPTIYSWEKSGLLKRIPIGGRVFFDPDDIRALIKKKKTT